MTNYYSSLKRPSRVTHVIYSGLGGHSAVMFSLLEAGFMSEARHHVVLAGIETPPEDYTTRLEAIGASWVHVGKREGRAHINFYRRLRSAIFGHSDVVFLHGVAAIPAVAMMVGRRGGASRHVGNHPVVLLRETEPTQVKTCRVWSMLALAYRCTDAVVYLTPEAAADARAKLRLLHRVSRTHIIANGLDTDFFSPASTEADQEKRSHQISTRASGSVLRLGMQSRLQPTKDHLTLIEAFAILRATLPGQAMTLEIAGDGPTRPLIEARIAALGLSNSIILHGMLGREQVRDFLRGLDLYVHCSFGETQSNAIMQAMATALPVVGSDVAGVSNMIYPGLGLLHRSGDAADLARQLQRLINDSGLAQQLGRAARSQAQAIYGAGASARAYEALIRRLQKGEA